MATGTNKKLFIPGKAMPTQSQPEYGTDMRAIEDWANNQAVSSGGAQFQATAQMAFTNGNSPTQSTALIPVGALDEAFNVLTSIAQFSDGTGPPGTLLSSVSVFGPTYSSGTLQVLLAVFVTDLTGANSLIIENLVAMPSGTSITGTTGWSVVSLIGTDLSLGSPQDTNLIETLASQVTPYWVQLETQYIFIGGLG